jgi:hypothetical protein
MNRRQMTRTLGLATIPFVAPITPAAAAPEGNRAAQFAIASAMSFFHGVMVDDHLAIEHRLEAARGLINGALYLDAAPDAKTGTTY